MSKRASRRSGKSRDIIARFISKGIRLFAFDFDQTLISIHTGGLWKEGTEKLLQHSRPCLLDLIGTALEKDVGVCIVTYSMQAWLIREFLKLSLPSCDTRKIIIRANTAEWRIKQQCGEQLGKEEHIASVLTELFNSRHQIIHPHEVVLLDDDKDNVDTALRFGHKALEITDDVCYEILERFADSL